MNTVVKIDSTEFDESLIDNNVEYSKLYFPYSGNTLCLVFICNKVLPNEIDIFSCSKYIKILNDFSDYISNEDKKLNFNYVGDYGDIDILRIFNVIKSFFIFNFTEHIPPYLTKYGYKIVLVNKKHEEYVKDNFKLIDRSYSNPYSIFPKQKQHNTNDEKKWGLLELIDKIK